MEASKLCREVFTPNFVKVDVELSAIVVTGAIPGSVGGLVYVRKAMKKRG